MIIALLILLLFPGLAGAAIYYVAPNGNNSNAGTQAAPFLTLQRAHDAASAGDTIYLRGGTYTLSNTTGRVILTKAGTSTNRINIFNFPGESPILDAGSVTSTSLDIIRFATGASWWHIKGFEIKNGPYTCIYMPGTNPSNNIIENMHIHHCGRLSTVGAGIHMTADSLSANNNLFLNNDIHNNGGPASQGNSDGIAMTDAGSGNIVRGNRFWRNGDDGIDVWATDNLIIDNNWSWENGLNDDLDPTGGNGQGFKLGGGGTADGGHLVTNNLAWGNFQAGFDHNGASIANEVYNNTAWSNLSQGFRFSAAIPHILKNNLIFNDEVAIHATVNDTFNSWNLAVTSDSSDFAVIDPACAKGPRRPDGRLPLCKFLRLVAGSDLLDKGTNSGVGLPFSGSNPDLGAFERSITNWPSGSPLLKEASGTMQLTADHTPNLTQSEGFPYVSGMITTEGSYTRIYGYYEARIKAPVGQGFLSAFWLFPSDCGNHRPEMDIFEAHGAPTNIFYTHAHPEAGTGTETNISGGHTHTNVIDSTDGYHIYGLEWTPTYIAWFADGVEVRRVVNYSNEGQYVLLSLAVGGNWQGLPDGTTPFPAHMDVDYVRIYQKP